MLSQKRSLTSNDRLLDERQGPPQPQPSSGLRSYNHIPNRQARHPSPWRALPGRPGNHTAVCAVITGAHLATGNTRLSFWMVFLVKVCEPGNGGYGLQRAVKLDSYEPL